MNRYLKTTFRSTFFDAITPSGQTSPYQEWLEEAEIALLALDDCRIECDNMTWVISYLFNKINLPHKCMSGHVMQSNRKKYITPHYWIELPAGYVVDLRLRMWFGDEDVVPHGIFQPGMHPKFIYFGKEVVPYKLTASLAATLTDTLIANVKLPSKPKRNLLELPNAVSSSHST